MKTTKQYIYLFIQIYTQFYFHLSDSFELFGYDFMIDEDFRVFSPHFALLWSMWGPLGRSQKSHFSIRCEIKNDAK